MIDHSCRIFDIVKISETRTNYICSVCKKLMGYTEIDEFNIVFEVYIDEHLADDHKSKIYPKDENAKYNEELLEDLV